MLRPQRLHQQAQQYAYISTAGKLGQMRVLATAGSMAVLPAGMQPAGKGSMRSCAWVFARGQWASPACCLPSPQASPPSPARLACCALVAAGCV